MAYEPFLKSTSFGLPNMTGPSVSGTCPAGQMAMRLEECFLGPCPELCVTAEDFALSGRPPAETPTATAGASGALSKMAFLWVAVPLGFLFLAGGPRRQRA